MGASGSEDTWSCKSTMNDFPSDDGSMKIISTNYDRWAIQYGCFDPMEAGMMSMDSSGSTPEPKLSPRKKCKKSDPSSDPNFQLTISPLFKCTQPDNPIALMKTTDPNDHTLNFNQQP